MTLPDLIVYDLDGVLAESRKPINENTAHFLKWLTWHYKVGITSGGSIIQIRQQVLSMLKGYNEKNLFLLPLNGAEMLTCTDGLWYNWYSERLTPIEAKRIEEAIWLVKWLFRIPENSTIYGKWVEDRLSQVTVSALGQDAPLIKKREYDPTMEKRKLVKFWLQLLLPKHDISIGGHTSIDVTRKYINKGYGVKRLCSYLELFPPLGEKVLFFGDKLEPSGNDFSVIGTGAKCIEVHGWRDAIEKTLYFIE